MKKLSLIILAMLLAYALVSCGECEHIYDGDCDTDCNECGEVREISHSFADADCDTPMTCTVCGETKGEALGHFTASDDGDCTTDVKCPICLEILTPGAAEHIPEADDGDCTTAIHCTVCDTVTTEAKNHRDEALVGKCDDCHLTLDYLYDEESDTYYIFNENGLYAWAEDRRYPGATLMSDVELSSEMLFDLDGDGAPDSNWNPLRLDKTFDGGGHSISGLVLYAPEAAIFGFISSLDPDGVVKNLTLVDVNITGNYRVGGIAGNSTGAIINCFVSGNVYAYSHDAAGIAGFNGGDIIACGNSADVYSRNGSAGGIVGQAGASSGSIIGCYNVGNITSDKAAIGGIVADFYSSEVILACYSIDEISGGFLLGSIAGYVSDGTAESCYYVGERGFGNENTVSGASLVDGTEITWEAAMTAMNDALSEAGYNWQYKLNTGADADKIPLVIVEVRGE